MKLAYTILVISLSLIACGGDVETHGGGGSCPTCSSGGVIVNNNACASQKTKSLASEPAPKGTKGGTPTTTSTTGTPFAAPVTNVTVSTPPSTSVSNSCGGAAPAP